MPSPRSFRRTVPKPACTRAFPALGVLRRTRTSDRAPGALLYCGFRFAARHRHLRLRDQIPCLGLLPSPTLTDPPTPCTKKRSRACFRGFLRSSEDRLPRHQPLGPTLPLPSNSRLRMFMFFGLTDLSCHPVCREHLSIRNLIRGLTAHRPRIGFSRGTGALGRMNAYLPAASRGQAPSA